jgi:GT2 family glycosyltransferase
MKSPSVIALILTYDDSEQTIRCIESLLNTVYENLTIYVVDNGSHPRFTNDIRLAYPDLSILSNPTNAGFSGGFNFGISNTFLRHPDADYFWLLNNDLEVHPNCLEAMVRCIDDRAHIGFAGPETYKRGGSGEHDQWITRRKNGSNPGYIFLENEFVAKNKDPIEVEFVVGHCMLIRTSALLKVGLIRDFFIYWEEVEWQWRAKSFNYLSCAVPGALAFHDRNSFQSAFNLFLRTRNYLFFNRLLLIDNRKFFPNFMINILLMVKDFISNYIRGRHKISSLWAFLTGFSHGLVKRIPDYPRLD